MANAMLQQGGDTNTTSIIRQSSASYTASSFLSSVSPLPSDLMLSSYGSNNSMNSSIRQIVDGDALPSTSTERLQQQPPTVPSTSSESSSSSSSSSSSFLQEQQQVTSSSCLESTTSAFNQQQQHQQEKQHLQQQHHEQQQQHEQQLHNDGTDHQYQVQSSIASSSMGSLNNFLENPTATTPHQPPQSQTTLPSSMSPRKRSSLSSLGLLTTRKSVDFAILPPSTSQSQLSLSSSPAAKRMKRSEPSYSSNCNNAVMSIQQQASNSSIPDIPLDDVDQRVDGVVGQGGYNGLIDCSGSNNNNNTTNFDNNLFVYPNDSCVDNCWTARQVVDAISTCICRSERMEAILNAIESLNHNSQELHNEEMSTGIDSAMTKHLTFLVYRYNLLNQQEQQQRQQKQKQKQKQIPEHLNQSDDDNISKNCCSTSTNETPEDYKKEISLTLDAMELLYRASSQIVGVSFQRMGHELLQLLISLMSEEILLRVSFINCNNNSNRSSAHSTAETDNEELNHPPKDSKTSPFVDCDPIQQLCSTTPDGDFLLIKATKLLAHLARVGNATNSIAHYPNLLSTLVELISIHPFDCIPWEARLSVLWTVANLACNPENMTMMVDTPNLIGALINVASRKLNLHDTSPGSSGSATNASLDTAKNVTQQGNFESKGSAPSSLEHTMEILRSRSIASRTILNLSWLPENRVRLAEQPGLVDLLCELIKTRTASAALSPTSRSGDGNSNGDGDGSNLNTIPSRIRHRNYYNKSKTIQDVLVTTRQHAVGALRNIAAAPRKYKVQLCQHRDGNLLNVLTDAALNDSDFAVQERVYGTIHNLANQDTAEIIVNHPALVLVLKNILLSSSSEHVLSSSDFGVDFDDDDTMNIDNSYKYDSTSSTTSKFDSQRLLSEMVRKTSPRQHASATLMILERSITSDMNSYENLRNLIDAVNPVQQTSGSTCSSASSSDDGVDAAPGLIECASNNNSIGGRSSKNVPNCGKTRSHQLDRNNNNFDNYQGNSNQNNHQNNNSTSITNIGNKSYINENSNQCSPVKDDDVYYDDVTGSCRAAV